MSSIYSNDFYSFTLYALICLAIWFWLMWWLISAAVKKGVSDLTNLMKKNLELKGVSKEEINEICGIEPVKEQGEALNLKRDKDGNVIGYDIPKKD